MKNLKLFLCLALATTFNAIHAGESPYSRDVTTPCYEVPAVVEVAPVVAAEAEEVKSRHPEAAVQKHVKKANEKLREMDTNGEMLAKIQIFQAIDLAMPQGFSNIKAVCKGIIEYSSEPETVKDCMRSYVEIIDALPNISTEAQAQSFATDFTNKIIECHTIDKREFLTKMQNYQNNQLPFIKIAQKTIAAFPFQTAVITGAIAGKVLNPFTSKEDKTAAKELIQALTEVQRINNEEEAQAFTTSSIKKISESKYIRNATKENLKNMINTLDTNLDIIFNNLDREDEIKNNSNEDEINAALDAGLDNQTPEN